MFDEDRFMSREQAEADDTVDLHEDQERQQREAARLEQMPSDLPEDP